MNLSDMLNKKKKKAMEENNKSEDQVPKDPESEAVIPEEESQIDMEDDVENASENLSEEERLKAEIDELQNKHIRLYAEFDNFKRRTSKERLELIQIAGKDVISDLLPVLDDFERAQKSLESAKDVAAVSEGVKLIHQK